MARHRAMWALLVSAVAGQVQAGAEEPPPRCAFATIVLSADFVDCAAAWAHSVRATDTQHEVVALVLPTIATPAREQLRSAGATQVVEVEEVANPNSVVMYESFSKNYAILRVWQLNTLLGADFHRTVYMDSDTLLLQNSDFLCDLPELSASRDLGASVAKDGAVRPDHGEDFNAGMMVLQPSAATFQRLLQLSAQVHSPSGGVQPLLRAAFPAWRPLDHLRDNVNARLFEHRKDLWKVGRIRSLHFTGPLKPCFTVAADYKLEPLDNPFRIWHRLRGRSGESCAGEGAPKMDNAALSSAEAFGTWFPVPKGSVLDGLVAFGRGEEVLKVLPASHVCKHTAAAVAHMTKSVFVLAHEALGTCSGKGGCGSVEGLMSSIHSRASQMQRTLVLFLQRASLDAKADLTGLGSPAEVIARYGDEILTEVQALEQQLLDVAVSSGPFAFSFDLVVGTIRKLRREEQLLRWELSHTLLGIVWHHCRQAACENMGIEVPHSFQMALPAFRFRPLCCREPEVFAALAKESRGPQAVGFVGPPSGKRGLELDMPRLLPNFELVVVDSTGAHDLALVILGCSDASASVQEEHEQILRVLRLYHDSRAVVAGCDFLTSRPGLVEAVSVHALHHKLEIHLATDGVWWLQSLKPG